MFGRERLRYKIIIVWVVVFLAMWVLLWAFSPKKEFSRKLDHIYSSISMKKWEEADKQVKELKKLYNKKKVYIQIGNATEALITFNYSLDQLEITIHDRSDAAFEYIGALKGSIDYVLEPFAGP